MHLPEWSRERPRDIESRLRQLRGVQGARADSVTGNVLVRFDPAATDGDAILSGDAGGRTAIKLGLNFLVPFIVSNLGLLAGKRAEDEG